MSFTSIGIYSREEFLKEQAAGNFNPNLSYERYLEIRQLRAAHQQQNGVNGIDKFSEESPELSVSDEEALDSAWAVSTKIAA